MTYCSTYCTTVIRLATLSLLLRRYGITQKQQYIVESLWGANPLGQSGITTEVAPIEVSCIYRTCMLDAKHDDSVRDNDIFQLQQFHELVYLISCELP